MGHARYLLFYLLCGVAAGLTQLAMAPSLTAPLVGASGAISGVLGAYLVLHPRARVLVPVVVIPLYLPAYLLLIFWIGFQVYAAIAMPAASDGNIAWWAHIGGFVAGFAVAWLLGRMHATRPQVEVIRPHTDHASVYRVPYRDHRR